MAESFALKVSDTLREYLKEIRGVLQETESEAERELQVSSALEEIEGSEVKVATDVECSRILETLIEAAPLELLFTLTERIVAREELFAVACKCVLTVLGPYVTPFIYRRLFIVYCCAAVHSARMCWRRYCFSCSNH